MQKYVQRRDNQEEELPRQRSKQKKKIFFPNDFKIVKLKTKKGIIDFDYINQLVCQSAPLDLPQIRRKQL